MCTNSYNTEHTNPPVHMVHSLYWLRESTCKHLIQTTKPIEKGRHLVDIKIKETKVYSFLQCSQLLCVSNRSTRSRSAHSSERRRANCLMHDLNPLSPLLCRAAHAYACIRGSQPLTDGISYIIYCTDDYKPQTQRT